LPKLSSWHLGI